VKVLDFGLAKALDEAQGSGPAVDPGGVDAREVRVVLNWFEELQRLVPVD
jgi:hypothetical protein